MGFDQVVIHCGAPALCGIKPANLFSMREDLFCSGKRRIAAWNKELHKEGVRVVPLRRFGSLILFYVYSRKLVERIVRSADVRMYLSDKGYKVSDGVDALLSELFHRLTFDTVFPHEVGLFLGYPLRDVVAFERTKGKHFRYSGLWKVYGDVAAARLQVSEYDACTKFCQSVLEQGFSVPAVVKKYKSVH